jgi:predicted ATP-dependent endonuclease of OLD family
LHSLNQSALKTLGESKSVTVSDARMNHLWRKAIWGTVPDLKLGPTNLKIEDFETKAKKIYSKIEDLTPLFFAFRADRQMTDADAEAKDPMQLAVAEAQEAYQSEIDSIKEKIQERVNAVAKLALEKLNEVDPKLANQLNPVLKSKPVWKFDYKIEDDKGIALNKRGSGTRRLVLLNFFRAQAEKKSLESHKGIIYAIEEPETSQHPDNQKMIIEALVNLAQDQNRQVVITTHSPELLREIKDRYAKGIRFIQKNSSDLREIESGNDALILSANALGILSKQMFGSAEKIVLVEGKKDCLFLEHAAKMMKQASEISKDFSDAKVELLPVGGCPGVKDWIGMKKHSELGLTTYVFLDSDRISVSASPTDNEVFISSLSSDSTVKEAFCTKKRETENYLDRNITGCTYDEFDDAKDIISSKTNIAKNKLIDQFWPQMTAVNIDQEIKDIVKKIIN